MCFMLYAGTLRPIPRNQWNEGAPDIWVRPLLENESPVMAHFTLPEIQYIGSSSGCRCDFPHLMFQNGGWPSTAEYERDEQYEQVCDSNRKAIHRLLRSLDENVVELYGIWAGDESEEPLAKERVFFDRILHPTFSLKERGF